MNKRDIEAIYPLSPMQQGMLFHALYAPQSGEYCQQISFTMHGDLDVAAFRRAWQRVMDRHAVLRTLFVWEARNEPLQVVRRQVHLPWVEEDWRGLAPEEQSRRLDSWLNDECQRGFDLGRAPLMRLALFRVAAAYQCVWSYHHLLLDGWSLPLVFRDAFTLYRAFSRAEAVTLPPVQPYRNYIAWLQKQDLAEAEQFWRRTLQGFAEPTPLPASRPLADSADQTPSYTELRTTLPADTTEALQALAQQHRLTLNTLTLGAWALLLSRYSGQKDVVFGAIVSGRPAELPGFESMVGLFINTLPVRAQVSPQEPLLAWLRRLQKGQAEARQYEYSPLVQIHGWSQAPRDIPLFESILVFENYPMTSAVRRADVDLDIRDVNSVEKTSYPLTVVAAPGPELGLAISYDQRRFDAGAVQRMLAHLQTLLTAMTRQPQAQLAQLPMLTEADRRTLDDWNDTRSDYPQDRCLHELFEAQAAQTPDAIAVSLPASSDAAGRSDDSHSQHLTYQALNRRTNQLAHFLQNLGVGPETPVGICLERSVEMTVALLGALKAGGAYLPLDPLHPPERLAFMLQDAQASVLLTSAELLTAIPALQSLGVRTICLDREWAAIAVHDEANLQPTASPQNPAYVIYTSGSTGHPKGVVVSHGALVNHALAIARRFDLRPEDRVLQFASISFDVAAEELFPSWLSGATVVLHPGRAPASLAAFKRLLAEERLTVINLPSPYWHEWVSDLSRSPASLPAALRLVVVGSERALPEQLARWQELVGDSIGWRNAYGPTEATITATIYAPDELAETGAPGPTASAARGQHSVPIGRPIANVQVHVLDEQLNPLPIGAPGELCIGGHGLARGYLGRPDLTAERFAPDPFAQEPGARLYRTGDLARWLPDGVLEFLGRVDHQVKVRGFRVELGEIEAVLGEHPAVQQAVALAIEEAPGDARLAAYVVSSNGHSQPPSVAELRNFVAARLPDYMTPASFIFLDALPLTPNGKVDRRALPAPDAGHLERDDAYVAPRTPVEELLAGIWAEVLRVEQVGVHDNFFELGGHSLRATQLISRLRDAFQVELPLRDLFEAATVAKLAQRITALRALACDSQAQPAVPIRPPAADEDERDVYFLSFAQERLWFLHQLDPDSPAYNIPAGLHLSGLLDVAALEQALGEIIERHQTLRTTFAVVKRRPVQTIHPAAAFRFAAGDWASLSSAGALAENRSWFVDLQNLPDAEREQAVQRLARLVFQSPFDLERSPPLRAMLLRLSVEEHLFLLAMHHIVADGWSVEVLSRELAALYQAYSAGRTAQLADLPVQYVDFANWQRQWLQGDVLEAQLAYWKQQLAGAPASLDLPTDYPRPAIQTFNGAEHAFELSPALSASLKALSRRQGVTLFMTLLAAFQALLHRYTGQEDISVGTPIANRNRTEIEGLIGFFTNTLVLRTGLGGNLTFRQLLRRLREVALDAYTHQDLPFEKLVEALDPERDLSHSPLFQVMFMLANAPAEPLTLEGLTLSPATFDAATAKFDLTLSLADTDEGLKGAFEYNSDLFEPATIARMAQHFQTLLAGIAADPDRRLAELPLLTAAEQEQILVTWNDTQADYPQAHCFHELFEAQAARTPDAVALSWQDQALTYAQLNSRANRLARHLRTLGVGPDVLVGIYVQRSPEMLVGLLAILKAGGAYLPLDPAYPAERLAFMLADAQASVLLTQQQLAGQIAVGPSVRVLSLDSDWPQIAQQEEANLVSGVAPDNLAYVLYTSGSTGRPKGVMIAHQGLVNYLNWCVEAYRVADGVGAPVHSSISFDLTVTSLLAPLLAGRSAVLLPAGQEIEALAAILRSEAGFSLIKITPAHLEALGQLIAADSLSGRVGTLVIGGEALWADDLALWRAHAPDTRVVNEYGPTETVVGCCVHQAPAGALKSGPIPIGRPIANTQLYLLDAQRRPVPIGVPGELYIGGAGVARGYLNRPGLTAEQFAPNPFGDQPGARLYRTGDLARYRPDGNIEFLGRIDHQVKVRGFRIELGEIEAVIGQHSSVRETAVLAREDRPGDKRLVAYVAPRQTGEQAWGDRQEGELRAFLAARLPDYMIPAAFVSLETLPLTPNGKLDRRALPAPDRTDASQTYAPPRDPIEEALVEVFADVLGLARVGIHDNFFQLGGHSLLATQVISRVRETLHVELPLRSLFETPTAAGLAQTVMRIELEQADQETLDELLAQLDQLSSDEVEALLGAA